MITIKEMAEKIGVSPTTVSNVIHGKTKEVSKETIKKINQVVKDCHYIPNMNARTLAQNSSKIIGVVMRYAKADKRNSVQDPFNSELLGALEANIRAAGYYMMLYASGDVEEIITLMMTWNVDGLIVLGVPANACQTIKKQTTKPIVFIDCYFIEDGTNYKNVGLEDEMGAYQMTSYLISQGHQRIAFLADNRIGVDRERWKGYARALEENKIIETENNFIQLGIGEQELEKSLEDLQKRIHEFTALFFASDYYAVKGMNYLLDHNVAVPDDISIIGFDDNILAQNMRPRLTTVHQDTSIKGEMAIRLLLRSIKNEPIEEENIRLSTRLVIRDTVKKLN